MSNDALAAMRNSVLDVRFGPFRPSDMPTVPGCGSGPAYGYPVVRCRG
jgi:hypothetical protein